MAADIVFMTHAIDTTHTNKYARVCVYVAEKRGNAIQYNAMH